MGARTGKEFLEALRADTRELWLEGARVESVVDDPRLAGAARSVARLFDLQWEHADDMLMASPTTGDPVSVTHVIPRSADDLVRRRHASELIAAASAGTMGRSPDYLNYTFACFAGRAELFAARGNDDGAANLVAYQAEMRDRDLCTTHVLVNPQVDRSVPEAAQAEGDVALHIVERTSVGMLVRGARMLATLAPFADELLVYPGYPLREDDDRYAVCFAVPMTTPGLRFLCRDSFAKRADAFDYPLSSRFDEQDAFCVFDDVEVPAHRVFVGGDARTYNDVVGKSYWRAHIVHQAMTRAAVKLEFATGLAHLVAETTGVAAFDHVQEKLGEIWSYAEMVRAGVIAAEACGFHDEAGVFVPDQRPFVALRGLVPTWMPRVAELIQLIGGGGFMCAPTRADVQGALAPLVAKYFQARNADAERRIRLFRLAWDFVGTALAGRGTLYERFYLGDAFRMTALAATLAPKEQMAAMVECFLRDEDVLTVPRRFFESTERDVHRDPNVRAGRSGA